MPAPYLHIGLDKRPTADAREGGSPLCSIHQACHSMLGAAFSSTDCRDAQTKPLVRY